MGKLKKLVIIGAGGCGCETAWIVSRINSAKPQYEILGFTDSLLPKGLTIGEHPVLGDIDWFDSQTDYSLRATISVSNPEARKQIAENLARKNPWLVFENIIDPSARISETISFGLGAIVYPDVGFSINARIGSHAIINARTIIGHDADIGSFCTISTSVDILGDVVIGEGSYVGSKSVILQKKKIGKGAVVGLGSVVIRNVPDGCTVFGNPAEIAYRRKP